ncbi:MAG: hypothetical protein HKO65_08600 [Gemmatimonadetes bacterium]|nr:hypothetical protein [Gemmatimonadota bacterium]NNM05146.1 hypothetical protein [Gemmatimonadota bacterium]
MTDPDTSPAARIFEAWARLEAALRNALPVCSVQPPTQPTELLSALRINHLIGPEEERAVLGLREIRTLAAHADEEPTAEKADRYEKDVAAVMAKLNPEEEVC